MTKSNYDMNELLASIKSLMKDSDDIDFKKHIDSKDTPAALDLVNAKINQGKLPDSGSLWNIKGENWADEDLIAFARLMKKFIDPQIEAWLNSNMSSIVQEEVSKHVKKMSQIRNDIKSLK